MKYHTISFKAVLKKFGAMGEKTGWTFIEVPADLAHELKPGNKKSFRVKGKIDEHLIHGVSLLPMGAGNFIMAVNATMRRAIAKKTGAMVQLSLCVDEKNYQLNKEFIECLSDEPKALAFFKTLATSHQNYFSKWIDSAKTEATKVKRISQAVFGLTNKMDYGTMIRYYKNK